METDPLLIARGSTHGEFRDNSTTSQQLKGVMRTTPNWKNTPMYMREGLEMIAHKIGRALNGELTFCDHWDDIVGYAKLIADRVKEDNK